MNLEVGITKHGDGDGSVPCPEFFESHPSRFITSQGDRHSTSPTMGVPLIMTKMVRFKRMQSKHWMILNHFFNNEQNKIISLMNNSCGILYDRTYSTNRFNWTWANKISNQIMQQKSMQMLLTRFPSFQSKYLYWCVNLKMHVDCL